jgi:DNA invertase Pin-like site-specific DNA recombinase
MKIIGYLRVSTDQQAESGLGLEAQRNAIADYAKKTGQEVCEIFSDEGLSGSLSLEKRPGMLGAISSLKKGDILVVAKRDRIGRDPLVVAMIESAITRKGAKIISAAEEGTNNDDPSSILMRRMIDAFGEYERLIIKARTKAALKTKKDKGQRVGHIPFGYKLADDGIQLEEDELEQSILSQMRDLRDSGYSIRKIAKEMNTREAFNRGLSKWNHASVHRVMKMAT